MHSEERERERDGEGGRERRRDGGRERGKEGGREGKSRGETRDELAKVTKCKKDKACFTCTFFFPPGAYLSSH